MNGLFEERNTEKEFLDKEIEATKKRLAELQQKKQEHTRLSVWMTEMPYETCSPDCAWQKRTATFLGTDSYYYAITNSPSEAYDKLKAFAITVLRTEPHKSLKLKDLGRDSLKVLGEMMSEISEIYNKYWREIRGITTEPTFGDDNYWSNERKKEEDD